MARDNLACHVSTSLYTLLLQKLLKSRDCLLHTVIIDPKMSHQAEAAWSAGMRQDAAFLEFGFNLGCAQPDRIGQGEKDHVGGWCAGIEQDAGGFSQDVC